MKPQRTRAIGFTIIELLVVLSIIGLLMSILVPALGLARETAKRTMCMANLRSISQIQWEYAGDYNQYFMEMTCAESDQWEIDSDYGWALSWPNMVAVNYPARYGGSYGGATGYDSRAEILKYAPNEKIFYCPDAAVGQYNYSTNDAPAATGADANYKDPYWGGWDATPTPDFIEVSYVIIAGCQCHWHDLAAESAYTPTLLNLGQSRGATWWQTGITCVQKDTNVLSPAQAQLAGDADLSDKNDTGFVMFNHWGNSGQGYNDDPQWTTWSELPPYSFAGGNTAYFDGHAVWRTNPLWTTSAGAQTDPYCVNNAGTNEPGGVHNAAWGLWAF